MNKGKEKATLPEETPQPPDDGSHHAHSDNSIVSRITGSVAALSASVMTSRPDLHDASQAVSTDKAASSAQPSHASTSYEIMDYGKSAAEQNVDGYFKSGALQEHVAREEAAFSAFLEGVDTAESPSYAAESIKKNAYAHLDADSGHRASSTPQASQLPHKHSYSATDGLDVVKLLNSDYDEVLQTEPIIHLTEEQSGTLRRILFSDNATSAQTSHAIDWEKVLNFFPSFWHGSTAWADNEMLRHVGTPDPAEARRIWANQWQDVLASYTDEVWGDLQGLVKEAREEVHQLSDPSQDIEPSDSYAVRRLSLILAHIRGH